MTAVVDVAITALNAGLSVVPIGQSRSTVPVPSGNSPHLLPQMPPSSSRHQPSRCRLPLPSSRLPFIHKSLLADPTDPHLSGCNSPCHGQIANASVLCGCRGSPRTRSERTMSGDQPPGESPQEGQLARLNETSKRSRGPPGGKRNDTSTRHDNAAIKAVKRRYLCPL
jgi:hypothetical protein